MYCSKNKKMSMLSLHECVGNQKQKTLNALIIEVKPQKISLEVDKIYLEEKYGAVRILNCP